MAMLISEFLQVFIATLLLIIAMRMLIIVEIGKIKETSLWCKKETKHMYTHFVHGFYRL